ncbi:ROK family protein [Echinicola shivajiensis]|uniref:ROK family protein n=1 Tax=Echinicola shivajiensis TaxID=1035916 RepID=UPI001BFC64E7|nr:ROK family protein [Echinicola shivajiensis]
MSNLPENSFFESLKAEDLSGVAYKNHLLKKKALNYFSSFGNSTIQDLSKALKISTPKMGQIILELTEIGVVQDYGKVDSSVGRRPNLYGLNASSAFFVGIEVKKEYINLGLTDFKNQLLKFLPHIPYNLDNTEEALDELCKIINQQIDKFNVPKSKIIGIGINLSGRINYKTGYSYSYFNFSENPLSKVFRTKTGFPTFLENDSRAMAFGEFKGGGIVKEEKNVLFINAGYGIGMGIMTDGKLVYGKSGFSGEIGHIPLFENEIICHCGKKGCLETEASGRALISKFYKKLQEGSQSTLSQRIKSENDLKLNDIINAALNDDVLAIELIDEIGKKLGRGISALLHLYNPELVIIGGSLAKTGDYLFLPIKMAINKYSLSLVSNDSKIVLSELGEKAGALGACQLVRKRLLQAE